MAEMKKKRGLVIGVDMDDVIFDFNDSLHAYHNAKYGTSVKRQDVVTYDLEDVWKCTPEEAARRVLEFYGTPEHDQAGLINGAAEAIVELSKTHELHIITSRGEQIRELTLRWVDEKFPGRFKSVQLTNHYFGVPEKKRSKAEVCEELGVDFMIEDSMSQAKEISGTGRTVFLLDTPWNQGELPKNVVRVHSWAEIVDTLKK